MPTLLTRPELHNTGWTCGLHAHASPEEAQQCIAQHAPRWHDQGRCSKCGSWCQDSRGVERCGVGE